MSSLLLACLLVHAATAASPLVPTVAGVRLESSRAAVIRALGKPMIEKPEAYSKDPYDYGDMVMMEYPGLRIYLVAGYNRKGPLQVLKLVASTSRWVVKPGLAVGMSVDEARRAFPALELQDDPSRPGKQFLSYRFVVKGTQAGGFLHLDVEDGRVAQVTLTSDVD